MIAIQKKSHYTMEAEEGGAKVVYSIGTNKIYLSIVSVVT